MPYLILFGNSWNQCSVDTAVIHLQRWVVPKDHSQFFQHVDAPPVPSSHLKPQPPCKGMNTCPPIIWVILASNMVILKHEALFKKIFLPLVVFFLAFPTPILALFFIQMWSTVLNKVPILGLMVNRIVCSSQDKN